MELSIVIPLFNEAGSITALAKKLRTLKSKFPKKTEIIFVDDGSNDATFALLSKLQLPYSKAVLSLSRNFGHQAALYAGLEAAKGKVIVTMDGDLQHPPEIIPQMLKLHRQGYEVVLTSRVDEVELSWFKKNTATWFYSLINSLSETKIQANTSDFRSLNREVLTALLAMPERRKFLRGMVMWLGFNQIIIPYQAQKRVAGSSKYSLRKMISLAFHALTSFSTAPLYMAGLMSVVFFGLAFLYAGYVVYVRFVLGIAVSGWASVQFVVLTIGGFLSLIIGLLGVYIAAMYEELKQRPLYVVKRRKYVKKTS